MMLWKNRSVSVGLSFAVIGTLLGVAFSGCCPVCENKPGQATPAKAGTTVKPADTPAAKPSEPAAKPAKPQAMLVEPAQKIGADASEAPAAPKVSTFAPAEDLAYQADQYIKKLEGAVASKEEYKDDQETIAKVSNTLAVIALALGLHDQESKYKASAGAVLKAAQEVAATKDYPSAKKAIAALKAAAAGEGQADVKLKWQTVAALPELMKQVPIINNPLKRYVKPAKFKKKAKDTAGYTAVIAAIAQGSMTDTSATKSADQAPQWRKFATAMRDDAGALNAAIHKGDQAAADKAMKKLAQSCDDCHAVFHPEVTK